MKALSYFVVVLFFLPSLGFAKLVGGGNDMGNGGDFVLCEPSPENKLSGYYALDYVLTKDIALFTIAEVNDLEASMLRIHQGLKKIPHLARSFRRFWESYRDKAISRRGIWEGAELELVDIKDEAIVSPVIIPDNCRGPRATADTLKLKQAVIRMFRRISGSPASVYVYDKELVESVETSKPLQMSFLLVHEWLWSHSQNVNRNRRVNHFFHSVQFPLLSEAELIETLTAMGLDLDVKGIPPKLFVENTCKPQSEAEKFTPPTGSTEYATPLEKISLASRSLLCDDNTKLCGTWAYTYWNLFLNNAHLFYINGENKLAVASAGNEVHMECDLEASGKVTCGKFRFLKEKFQTEPMTGYYKKGCLQLEGKAEWPVRNKSQTEYHDFRVLSRNLLPNGN